MKPPKPFSHTSPSTLLRSLTSSNILQQASWLAAAKVVQGAASIIATLVVGRHLGPTAFGLLSLASAIALFVSSAASLGLEQVATRELSARHPQRHAALVSALWRVRLSGALAGCAILLAIAYMAISHDHETSSLLFVLCLLPIAQVGDLSEWRLVAAGHSRIVAIATVLSSPLAAIARMAFAVSGAGITTFAWLLVGEWSLRSVLLAWATRNRSAVAAEPGHATFVSAFELLRDGVPLLLSGIAVFIYMRIDQFMIAAILGPREVGLYSAVVTIAEAPLVLPVLLLRASLPVLSRHSETDKSPRDLALIALMRGGFYLHLATAFVVAILARPLTEFLYGSAFNEAASALRIQVLAAPFVALGVLSSSWLVLERATRHILHRTLAGAALNVLLNLFMIPRQGIAGAAMATLAAQAMAGYLVDLIHPDTRALFRLKTLALWPFPREKS